MELEHQKLKSVLQTRGNGLVPALFMTEEESDDESELGKGGEESDDESV